MTGVEQQRELVVGAAIVRDGRVLAARRGAPAAAAGRWEFPGGKAEAGEDAERAVVREVEEELGCRVAVTDWLRPEVPIRPGLFLRVATAKLLHGEPTARAGEHDEVRWLTAEEVDQVAWLDADRPFTDPLRKTLVGQN
jgi:8-oxo-dGTP diphosphatase